MNKSLTPLLLVALLSLSQCKKKDLSPEQRLPPATQTGANTFGCLVNDQAWLPSQNYAAASVALYEPGASQPIGGNLNIHAFRDVQKGQSNTRQTITLAAGPIRTARLYSLTSASPEAYVSFSDRSKAYPCNDYSSGIPLIYQRGSVTITRIDEQAGVLAGTFEFVLAQPGCDTIRVTQGLFDYKL